MYSTNYTDTLILIAPDCRVGVGTSPPRPGTIATLQFEMLRDRPYQMTSDDLMAAVEAARRNQPGSMNDALRRELFAKPRACLRASPLPKTYGWGLHHDARSRVALVACESDRYRALTADPDVVKVAAMRSSRS